MKLEAPLAEKSVRATSDSPEARFDWPLCYEAENLILEQLTAFTALNSFTKRLEQTLRDHTGTLLLDWVDHLIVSSDVLPRLLAAGFVEGDSRITHHASYLHPEAMLPRVLVDANLRAEQSPSCVALKVDSVSDFAVVHRVVSEPAGEPFSRFRRLPVTTENGASLDVIERRGYRGFEPGRHQPGELNAILKAHELWKTRRRIFDDDADGFRSTHELLDRIIAMVGRDMACHIVFAEERAYWQSRNRAGQLQKLRQDQAGFGWANHDHHTFRNSRQHFVQLMRALEKLGFERRERYYAGAEAGWGAQILEQPVEGIVAFCDVDLEPDETRIDFSRQPLPPSKRLGTIGLWVGLHGESLLDAGMHHLECRFDHELLREQLAWLNVNTMKPFSDFPFLKQAFTEGERWPVRPERVERLLRSKLITAEQADKFLKEGAIGSHLENLQRKGGFKGFNQKSVSAIIDATDPRKQNAPRPAA
jgi:hypothetical protein